MNYYRPEMKAADIGNLYLTEHHPGMDTFHFHDEPEINIVTSGNASYLLEERHQTLRMGAMVLIGPGKPHLLLNPDEHFSMWVCVFRPEAFSNVLDTFFPIEKKGGFLLRYPLQPEWDRLCRLCTLICESKDHPQVINSGLEYLLSMFLHFFSSADTERTLALPDPVNRFIRHASKAAASGRPVPSIEFLAGQAGVSHSHLCRLFISTLKISPSHYLDTILLHSAIRYYSIHREEPIELIAERCGFRNYHHAYRAFKRETGMSPIRYLKSRCI
jgi:AraC-like DNA-binding protein